MSKCIKCGNLFVNNPPNDEMCHICRISDLETKLAESEERYKKAYREGLLQKQFDKDMEIMQLKQQLAEKETRIAELEDKDWYEGTIKQLEEQNERLIKQLAEKDRELYLTKDTLKHHTNIYNSLVESRQQDKIEFAIEQLEKVKEFYVHNVKWTAHENMSMIEYIYNQINELKEGK